MSLSVTIVSPDELGAAEAARWDQLRQGSRALLSPFFALRFTQIVGRARPHARVAVVQDGGEIVAFLPFEISDGRVGQPIGRPMNDLHGFICPSAGLDVRTVVRKAGLRGWRFTHAPAEQELLRGHRYDGTEVPCPVIDLSAGHDAYLAAAGLRSGRSVRKRRAQRKAFEREAGELTFEWNSPDPADLRLMMNWKAAKYHSSRALFADAGAVQIIEELAAGHDGDCAGVLSVLRAGGRPVAVHFGIAGASGLSWWFPAYDPDVGRYSPGTFLLMDAAEAAAERHVKSIDLGYGQDPYKFSLATASYPVVGGGVWATRAEAGTRRLYRRYVQARTAAPADAPTGSEPQA